MADGPTEIPELPAERSIDRLVLLLEPLSRVIRPQLYGVEHLSADGSLPVGNHTIYGDEMPDVIIDQNTAIYRAIILGIQFLREDRDQDPNRSLLARLRRAGVPRDPGAPRMSPRGVDHHRPET